MILEDKYRLKDRGSYCNYKDEVLDFITVFTDYFLSVYKPEFDKRNLNEYVRVHVAIEKGLSVLQDQYWSKNEDTPPLKETLEYYHNLEMKKIIERL